MRNADIIFVIKKYFKLIIDLLYPPFCIACNEILEIGSTDKLCPICLTQWNACKSSLRAKFHGVPIVPMTILGVPEEKTGTISSLSEYHSDQIIPEYEVQRKIVFALKRNDFSELTDFITDELYSLIREVAGSYAYDTQTVITSIPRNRRNVRKIGVDNMKTIAKKLAKKFKIEYVNGPSQKLWVKEQKKLSAKGRAANMQNSYFIKQESAEKFKNRRVLLLDDVVTTGSSVKAAAGKIIHEAGASQVLVFSITMNSESLLKRI